MGWRFEMLSNGKIYIWKRGIYRRFYRFQIYLHLDKHNYINELLGEGCTKTSLKSRAGEMLTKRQIFPSP